MLRTRFTSSDLELLPQLEGVRYEIIDGELYVSTQPSLPHSSSAPASAGLSTTGICRPALGWHFRRQG